tara:strand:- start:72 stop:464 length:393 start_codon:yes stop_codon:yes gene_type:complete
MYLRKRFLFQKMIKALTVSIAVAGAAALASPAQAEGFYVNPEYNAGWVGSDFTAGVLDAHVGYESGAFYLQGGPSVLMVDGADAETGFSGKTGLSTSVSDNVDMYTELSFAKYEDVDAGYGLKLGAKYSF